MHKVQAVRNTISAITDINRKESANNSVASSSLTTPTTPLSTINHLASAVQPSKLSATSLLDHFREQSKQLIELLSNVNPSTHSTASPTMVNAAQTPSLPNEILRNILLETTSSPTDLTRLRSVSKQFQSVADSNFLWQSFHLPTSTEDSNARLNFIIHPEKRAFRYLQIDSAGKDYYQTLKNTICDLVIPYKPQHERDEICHPQAIESVHCGALPLTRLQTWVDKAAYRMAQIHDLDDDSPAVMLQFFPLQAVLNGHLDLDTLEYWMDNPKYNLSNALASAPMTAIAHGQLDRSLLEKWLCHPSLDYDTRDILFGSIFSSPFINAENSGAALSAIHNGYLHPQQLDSWIEICAQRLPAARYALKAIADGKLTPAVLDNWLHNPRISISSLKSVLSKGALDTLYKEQITPSDLTHYFQTLSEIPEERRKKVGKYIFDSNEGQSATMHALALGQISNTQIINLLSHASAIPDKKLNFAVTDLMRQVVVGNLSADQLLSALFDPAIQNLKTHFQTTHTIQAQKSLSLPSESPTHNLVSELLQTLNSQISTLQQLQKTKLSLQTHPWMLNSLSILEEGLEKLQTTANHMSLSEVEHTLQQLCERIAGSTARFASNLKLQRYGASFMVNN